VFLYLLRLADRCHVDISAAALEKLRKNAAKYPADRCRGSSDKYTAYANAEAEDGAKAGAGGSKGGEAAISSSGSSSSGSSRNRCSAAGGEGKAEGDVRVEAREDAVGDTSEHAAKKQRTLNA
jgi:dCTP diphosphatase